MTVTTEPTAHQMIPELLARYRPERYDAGSTDWMDPVVDLLMAEIDPDEARRALALSEAKSYEASGTRSTNALLRQVATSGAWPLDWMERRNWPLALDGKRVRLGDATADDFDDFANRERRAAALDFTARDDACEGAQKIAAMIREQGVKRADQLVVVR